MKKVFTFFAACMTIAAAATFASCGSASDKTIDIEASSVDVTGDSADVVSVEDGTYKLTCKAGDPCTASIAIKLKLNQDGTGQDVEIYPLFAFKLMLLDDSGVEIVDLDLSDAEAEKVAKFISTGKAGDTKEFTFSEKFFNDDVYKKVTDGAAKIALTEVKYSIPENERSSSSLSSSSESGDSDEEASDSEGGSSEDFAALLSSYEEYVDQYIALMKKAQAGDMSAMTEYASFMEKAQDLSDKMSKCQDNASAADWAKFTKIQAKMLDAMK